ncbi:MAG: hypothetical protein KDB80_11730 [Planctomycetes bacterium]|nr:hypothetical protein [Planctomycetota bacterium]
MPRSAADLPGRRVVVTAFTLLVVVLPALVCGVGIDAKVTPAEVARVAAAASDPDGESLGPTALFYTAIVDAPIGDPTTEIPRARLATVLGVAVLSGVLYLVLAFVGSRALGILACGFFACAPSVADATLRPEVPAAVFGMLALLVLAGLPTQLRHRRRRSLFGNVAVVLGSAICSGAALGLSIASLPGYAAYLLFPGGCAMLAVVFALVRFVGFMRRQLPALGPFWGFTRRTAPWLACAVAALACSFWLLDRVANPEPPTITGHGIWPDSPWLAVPLGVCVAIGAVVWSVRVGLRLGRSRRVEPDTVLFVFVATVWIWRVKLPTGADALPTAPAFAIPAAIGARAMLEQLVGRLRATSRRGFAR